MHLLVSKSEEEEELKIVSFTRSTPDTAAKVEVDAGGEIGWGDAATVVNPWDEYALEETIVQAKAAGASTVVVAIGPAMHNEALKHSLAMGLDEALRVDEPALAQHDSLAYATLAAAAIGKIGDVGLVILGKESVDVATDAHLYQMARKLDWTLLSNVSRIIACDLAAGTIEVERTIEAGKETVVASLPAVLTVLKGINEPRYPSFIGIRKASKAEIPVWNAADLAVSLPASASEVVALKNPPRREVSTQIIDGETPAAKAAVLVEKLLEEKVL
jgi:electron transfer flavoprotein beta subunit